jgi:hypothetical protein
MQIRIWAPGFLLVNQDPGSEMKKIGSGDKLCQTVKTSVFHNGIRITGSKGDYRYAFLLLLEFALLSFQLILTKPLPVTHRNKGLRKEVALLSVKDDEKREPIPVTKKGGLFALFLLFHVF